MSANPYVKWFPSDFLHGVADLDYREIAVYTVVLNLIYDAGAPIADDVGRIARRCGMQKPMCEEVLRSLSQAGKITRSNGLISNGRAEKELEIREEKSKKAKTSADTRWSIPKEKRRNINDGSVRLDNERICVSDANQSPESRVQKVDSPPPNGGGAVVVTMEDPKKRLYDRARAVLGEKDYGKMVTQLLKAKNRSLTASLSVIEAAAGAADPRRYVWGAIKGAETAQRTMLDDGDVWRQM